MFEKILSMFKSNRGPHSTITRERLDDLEHNYIECEGALEYVHPAHCLDLIDEIRRLHGWPSGMVDRNRYRTKPSKPTVFHFPGDFEFEDED